MGFALFFLGESANIIFMCALVSLLFLGGWYSPFGDGSFFPFWEGMGDLVWIPGYVWFALKTVLILFLFIWVRVAYPRYRYDQLMRLGWKVFLPLSLAFLITTAGLLIHFNILPF
jgi:NADH-quinone oxidoreductase subunit H